MRLSLFGFAVFLAIGCNPTAAPLVIGHVAPFSGADKDATDQAANGIRLALEDYAAQKPLRPAVVRNADDRGDLDTAEGQAVRLVTLNHAFVLLGGIDSPEASRLDRAGSLLLSPIGQRAKSMSELVIVTGLSPSQLGKTLALYLSDSIKPTATVLLVEPGDEASSAEAAFLTAWAHAKRPAPSRQEFSDPASDTIKKWAEGLPQEVLPILIGAPATLKTLALETPLRDRPLAYVGPESLRRPFKDRTAPIYVVSSFGGEGKAAEFAKRYEAKFQMPAEPHAVLAYDDMQIALELLKKGLQLPKALRDDLNALKEFPGLTGTYKIADGIVERPAFAGRLEKAIFIESK